MPKKLTSYDGKGELPPGAIVLDDTAVLNVFWKTVNRWRPQSEMWSLTITGSGILGALGLSSGMVSSMFYHTAFNVGRHARRLNYLPAVLLSAAVPPLIINRDITERLILRQNTCPICLELRAGGYQAGLGGLYPVLMASACAMLLAKQNATYPLPDLKQFRQLGSIFVKLSRPYFPVLTAITVVNFTAGMVLVRYQQKAVAKVTQEMIVQ